MSDLAKQLAELQKLRDSGALSQEHYALLVGHLASQASAGSEGSAGSAPSLGAAQESLIPPPRARVPDEIGSYKVLDEVGRGGMGVVYRARHVIRAKARRQGGDVALKLMHAEYAHDKIYRQRFIQEASVVMDLEHPGIVQVLDMVKDASQLALIMELIQGETLSTRQRRAPMRWQEAIRGLQRTLPAVRYAHNSGVVHRDLKPSNVMVTPEGDWKIMDFGLAKAGAGQVSDITLTMSQGFLGTAAYMAPEQALDAKSVDQRADVYCLGVMLWELLLGRPPWEATLSPIQVYELKREERLVDLDKLPGDVPEELGKVAWRACRANPSQRFGSIAAMETAISLALEHIERRASLHASVVKAPSPQELRELERIRREKEEAERKRKEEEARTAAEEAERKRKEEEARTAAEEAERKRKEEEARTAAEEAERKRKEEEARKLAEQAERKRKEEKEEEARKTAEEAERKRKEEEARRLAEQAERKRKEEETRRLAQEAERKRKEEEARRLAEEAERKRKEEEARRAAEEVERKRKEEEARRLAQEAERKRKEEEARRLAEEAERKRKEEEARRLAEEAERKRKEEEARRAAEEAERKRKEEEARKLAEEAERAQQERARSEEIERARKQELWRQERQRVEQRRQEEAERQRREEAEQAAQAAQASESDESWPVDHVPARSVKTGLMALGGGAVLLGAGGLLVLLTAVGAVVLRPKQQDLTLELNAPPHISIESVTVGDPGDEASEQTWTGARQPDGRFRFDDLPTGDTTFTIVAGVGEGAPVGASRCRWSVEEGLEVKRGWLSQSSTVTIEDPAPTCPTYDLDYDMVLIPAGEFRLGSDRVGDESLPEELRPASDEDSPGAISVKPFLLGGTEVTQALYAAVSKTNPVEAGYQYWQVKNQGRCSEWAERGDRYPVVCVSWEEVLRFCNELSILEGLEPAYSKRSSPSGREDVSLWRWNSAADGYRLPTEKEWEYASKLGGWEHFAGAEGSDQVCQAANVADASASKKWSHSVTGRKLVTFGCADNHAGLAEVASYPPSSEGLFDLTGNVEEWIWGTKVSYLDEQGPPQHPDWGYLAGRPVKRGGSFLSEPRKTRITSRADSYYTTKTAELGFRLVRNAPGSELISEE